MLLRLLLAACAMLAGSSPAAAAWHEAKTRHFIIYSDQSPEELRDYATRLEKFDSAVRIARYMPDPPLTDSGKLRIYVLRDQQAVTRMAGWREGSIAGFYLSDVTGGRIFVFRKSGNEAKFGMTPEIVFFHEYFHHMMLAHTDAAMPRWVVEGFAEFFSTAEVQEDGSVMLGRPAEHRALALFLLADVSLKKLLDTPDRNLSQSEIQMIYGRGWLLAHYLAFEPSRQGQLDRYLRHVQQGRPALEAAEEAFGDLRQLSREIDRYLKQKTLPGLRVPAEELDVGPVAIRPLSPARSALLDVRMRLDRKSDLRARDAARIAVDARRVAARFPNDPFVHSTIARAELDAREFWSAVAAADRALALNPNSMEALTVKARALMELAAPAPNEADWTGIRELILKANRLDPESAEPLMLFYQSFAASGSAPTASAVKALLYARVLMPQDDHLRLMAARQLVVDGNFADARTTIAPMAFDPHAQHRDLAEDAVTAVASGDRAAALAALDRISDAVAKESSRG